ncbi:hypothetical protein [Dysgonomonas sp. 520]|uniref:hypothetical protein n=1 Tax=Dysgonomonas sp. 520 TaxID=2302931 RepID=UPI0013D45AE8|nr:hypothetical protein [Dysgonomonas sp. 520]NDW10079.1 hypothetical protein [Dysgonomonas sp. 520]
MKKNRLIQFTLLSVLFIFFATTCKEVGVDGKCSDNINPKKRNVTLSSSEDSVVIETKRQFWWIDGVNSEEEYYYTRNEKRDTVYGDWFVVTKESDYSFKIKVRENDTEDDRKINVILQAGNCFDYVTATQIGK